MVKSRRWYTRRFWIIWVVTIVVYLMVILKLQRLTALNLDVTGVGCGACPFEFDNHSIFPVSQYVTWSFSVSKEDVPFGILKSGQSSIEKVDWNAYEFYDRERNRSGPGEQGRSFTLELSGKEKEFADRLFDEYKYNAYISDHISVERAIEDTRTAACKVKKFIKNIPENSVSVIIVFYNERKSMLLRTVHSVVNRSPSKLLREIILVDDLSVKEELKTPLDLYIRKHFKKVKIVRNQERLGLIKSRIAGADASTGSFLIFFDAQIEVNVNYLPPLLEPIALDYKTIACPMIDFIYAQNLQIIRLNQRIRGGFDWNLKYARFPVQAADETTPHPSPVMIGCAFAISRLWWEQLEKFDRGLEIWGGEQFELSFKSWMCGGSIVDAPCSRIAHLFRELPYLKELKKDHKTDRNLLRVAKVWMDNYTEYIIKRNNHMQSLDTGDLRKQCELKRRLNCKSFKWFLEQVAPDILERYPVIEPSNIAWGQMRSSSNISMCISITHKRVFLVSCDKNPKTLFTFNWRNHIRSSTSSGNCLMNPADSLLSPRGCQGVDEKPSESFAWDQNTGHIVNFKTQNCLDFDEKTRQAFASKCDQGKPTQSWTFDGFNSTQALKGWLAYIKQQQSNKH